MAFQRETRLRGTAGLGESSFRSRIDNRDSKPIRAALQARNRMKRRRLVECLHRLGPAPLFHFLDEIERGASVPDRLERYAKIDPDFVRALGGDRFAPVLHVIAGSSRS